MPTPGEIVWDAPKNANDGIVWDDEKPKNDDGIVWDEKPKKYVTVEIPGYDRPIDFPDTMSRDEISMASARLYRQKAGVGGQVRDGLGSFYDESPLSLPEKVGKATMAVPSAFTAHPVELGKAILSAPNDAIQGIVDGAGDLVGKAVDSFKNGDYISAIRHATASLIPVLGPGIDRAGDEAQRGEYGKATGRTLGIASNLLLPNAAEGVASKARGAADWASPRLYQSAVKPIGMDIDAVEGAMRTGPKEGINPTSAGRKRLADLLNQSGQEIRGVVASAPPDPVISSSDLSQAIFKKRGGLLPSEQEILDSVAEKDVLGPLRQTPGDPASALRNLTPQEAWDLKVRLQNAAAKAKAGAYESGARNGPSVETYQSAAGNLGDQLVAQFPELAEKNRRYSSLKDLEPITDAATKRISNRDPWGGIMSGLAAVAGSGAGGAIAGLEGSLGGGALSLVATKILTNPILRTKAAIYLASQSGGALSAAEAASRLSGLAKTYSTPAAALGAANAPERDRPGIDIYRPR